MKDTKQIIKDCGIADTRAGLFLAGIVYRKFTPSHADGAIEETMGEIIGALYRRIEKLEEKRERLKETIQAMRTNASGLRNPDAFARPDLQSQRDASARSMEFWALRIEGEAL